MNGWTSLDRFLRTDPRDVGCAEAIAMLHVYVDLVAAGAPVQERYPGIAAHLRACGPCGEDSKACWPPWRAPGSPENAARTLRGLLAVVRGEED